MKTTSWLGTSVLTVTDISVSDLFTWKFCFMFTRDLFVISDLLPFSCSLNPGATAVG